MSIVKNPTTTIRSLRQALHAALAPLGWASDHARVNGRVWFELTEAGYRLTVSRPREWARAYAPCEPVTHGQGMAPVALSFPDALNLSEELHSNRLPGTYPVHLDTRAGCLFMEVQAPDSTGPFYRSPHTRVYRTASPAGASAPEGPFPLPQADQLIPSPVPTHAGTLASLLGASARLASSPRLYAVPGQPTLTDWSIGDWAHGRLYTPPRHRTRPRDLADEHAGLAARHDAAVLYLP